MKQEIAERWVTALRSGDYIPTPDDVMAYEANGCRCAVGVLWDIYEKETGLSTKNPSFYGFNEYSQAFLIWAGIKQSPTRDTFLRHVSLFYESRPHDYGNAAAYILEHYADEDQEGASEAIQRPVVMFSNPEYDSILVESFTDPVDHREASGQYDFRVDLQEPLIVHYSRQAVLASV